MLGMALFPVGETLVPAETSGGPSQGRERLGKSGPSSISSASGTWCEILAILSEN